MNSRLRLMTATAAACGALAGTVVGMEPETMQATVSAMPATALTVLPATVEPVTSARTSAIPEPVSLAVFGTGLLLLLRRRRS